jgi:hypothetical protein
MCTKVGKSKPNCGAEDGAAIVAGLAYMADEVDIGFLGRQIKRLEGDVRQLKSEASQLKTDVNQFHLEQLRLEREFALLGRKLDRFGEHVDNRFDQTAELIKSNFRILATEINSLKQDRP